jgi:hypothetical protein
MKLSAIIVMFIGMPFTAHLFAEETIITFEGRYEFRTDAESLEIIGEQICFFPTKPSSKNVPRAKGVRRLPWFCFTNSSEAAHLLGVALNDRSNECGFKGSAKINVSSYKRYIGDGGGNDVAILDAVLFVSKPENLTCSR